MRDCVDGLGAAGPLLFIPISAGLTVALFPGPLLAGASGLLFGTALGTPVSIVVGDARRVAGLLPVALVGPRRGRGARRPAPERAARLGRAPRLPQRPLRADRAGVPYSLVNYAAGLTPVLLRSFVAATAIGCAPRAFAYTALGGSLGDLGSPEAIVAVVVLVVMAVVGAAFGGRDVLRARRA